MPGETGQPGGRSVAVAGQDLQAHRDGVILGPRIGLTPGLLGQGGKAVLLAAKEQPLVQRQAQVR